ncbi:hypothetical protein [Mycobacterium sp. SMC-4]|uniref:hypothetical protein n=1 Tax=Mycobacterium sp. SMC-4 TaxID=2857059 RepID=UPI003D086166
MRVKKMVAGAMIVGGLGTAATALGAGGAAADPHWWHPKPPSPGHVGHVVGIPPGHLGQWVGVPPGHWDKPFKWIK